MTKRELNTNETNNIKNSYVKADQKINSKKKLYTEVDQKSFKNSIEILNKNYKRL